MKMLRRRFFSIVLACMIVFQYSAVTVFAADSAEGESNYSASVEDLTDEKLTDENPTADEPAADEPAAEEPAADEIGRAHV